MEPHPLDRRDDTVHRRARSSINLDAVKIAFSIMVSEFFHLT
jgi:hypothetical protein